MLVWLGWLLATCGFGILLGGVASMQQVRLAASGNRALPQQQQPARQRVPALAAAACGKLLLLVAGSHGICHLPQQNAAAAIS